MKGGGKEGQGPRQSGSKKGEKAKESVTVTKVDVNNLFAFTCTADYTAEAKALNILNENCRACLDSGTSNHYCPNCNKFKNCQVLMGHNVITADSHKLKAAGIGDVHIELSNRLKQTPSMLQGTIHTPEIAFMLISIGHLDKESCQVVFGKGVCTIHNHKGWVMVVIPHEDGLYQFAYGGPEHTNIVLAKMSISEAHCKLCHIGHATICHTVSKGMITGIELDMELRSKFCKPYDEQVHTQCM